MSMDIAAALGRHSSSRVLMRGCFRNRKASHTQLYARLSCNPCLETYYPQDHLWLGRGWRCSRRLLCSSFQCLPQALRLCFLVIRVGDRLVHLVGRVCRSRCRRAGSGRRSWSSGGGSLLPLSLLNGAATRGNSRSTGLIRVHVRNGNACGAVSTEHQRHLGEPRVDVIIFDDEAHRFRAQIGCGRLGAIIKQEIRVVPAGYFASIIHENDGTPNVTSRPGSIQFAGVEITKKTRAVAEAAVGCQRVVTGMEIMEPRGEHCGPLPLRRHAGVAGRSRRSTAVGVGNRHCRSIGQNR